jgi:hypothetical protein
MILFITNSVKKIITDKIIEKDTKSKVQVKVQEIKEYIKSLLSEYSSSEFIEIKKNVSNILNKLLYNYLFNYLKFFTYEIYYIDKQFTNYESDINEQKKLVIKLANVNPRDHKIYNDFLLFLSDVENKINEITDLLTNIQNVFRFSCWNWPIRNCQNSPW